MQTHLQSLFNGVTINAVESGTLLYVNGKSIRLEDGKTNTCIDDKNRVLYMTKHIYERLKDELSKRNF